MGPEDDGTFEVTRWVESEIGVDLADQLKLLLKSSFPGYPDRSYFKLPPHFRFLGVMDGVIVAHMGVEFRVVRAGENIFRTFGIVDLCVQATARSRHLATRLLAEATAYARACAIDFVLLFADDDRLYVKNGWSRADNPCTWVKINEHVTLGTAHRQVPGAFMVKTIQGRDWPEGEVDLLGHIF
jgi:GNAT superfamily N-acetyltransferase